MLYRLCRLWTREVDLVPDAILKGSDEEQSADEKHCFATHHCVVHKYFVKHARASNK